MRLVPMDLCCVNRTICETQCRDAPQFSPAALAITPLQSPSISNPATHRNRLDRGSVADNLKVHGINVRKPPPNSIAIVRLAPRFSRDAPGAPPVESLFGRSPTLKNQRLREPAIRAHNFSWVVSKQPLDPDVNTLSVQWHQHMKRTIPAPAIEFKVAVECKNVSGVQLVGEVNQACIGKAGGQIAILAHDASHGRRGPGKLKGDLKDSALDVLKDGLGRSSKSAQQVATLGNHRLAGDQRPFQTLNGLDAPRVPPLASVQKRHDHPGVQERGPHRPNPRKCFLFEPRSGRPEANRPTPITRFRERPA